MTIESATTTSELADVLRTEITLRGDGPLCKNREEPLTEEQRKERDETIDLLNRIIDALAEVDMSAIRDQELRIRALGFAVQGEGWFKNGAPQPATDVAGEFFNWLKYGNPRTNSKR